MRVVPASEFAVIVYDCLPTLTLGLGRFYSVSQRPGSSHVAVRLRSETSYYLHAFLSLCLIGQSRDFWDR